MYDERTFRQSFGDQCTLSVRIIVNDSDVRERKVEKLQIGEAGPITADDDVIGDTMPTLPDAPRHAINGRLG